MDAFTLPPISDGARVAISDLIDCRIAREYGRTSLDGQPIADLEGGAKMIATAGLQFDLRKSYTARTGSDHGLDGYVQTTLRILIRDGLAARVCQCSQLHPTGCPHGSAVGSLWCGRHYEEDVPAINGALVCGTCHVVEHESRT